MGKENLSQSTKLKEFNNKSDDELLDVIAWVKDEELAKAILNQRFKKVVQENTESTSRFNKIMISLTVVLVVLTTVLVWLTIKLI